MNDTQPRVSVLIVEDEALLRAGLRRYLGHCNCEVREAGSVAAAIEELERLPADLALVDFGLPDGTGDEVIRWALSTNRVRAAYLMTGLATCKNVVVAMRAGAVDVLEKPFDLSDLTTILAPLRPVPVADIESWRRRVAPELVSQDSVMLDLLRIIRSISDSDCTVLVEGESGTGKELIARAIHGSSPRKSGPFVALNCAAIPESLIEAELFGHTRNAFTGAQTARAGSIATANGGVLFLDEIGDMPLAAQGKLLRVLQERQVTPVGSDQSVPIDVRVVAATNKDLEAMVQDKTFRADLYFRLNVIQVSLPPLRERVGDVQLLARNFLREANRNNRRTVSGFSDGAEQALLGYGWPGNVRELQNVVERAVLLCADGLVTEAHLQLPRRGNIPSPAKAQSTPKILPSRNGDDALNLRSAMNDVERHLIQEALERSGGNRAEAAALLGLNRTTLVEKIRKFSD